MEYTKLTIKHFISDLPRIINSNFDAIKNLFGKFVDESTSGTILLKGKDSTSLNGEFSVIDANTVKARNIYITEDNRRYSLREYIEKCIAESLSND